jgi:hypothetical protein
VLLRGHSFHCDEDRAGRSPHLPAGQAADVVDMALDRYLPSASWIATTPRRHSVR